MSELISTPPAAAFTHRPSDAARQRIHAHRGEPLFIAAWQQVVMLHLEVNASALQRDVPYQLDLHHGRAFVTLVAFTLQGMRPALGGRFTAALFRPIASHEFLNVRTYVVQNGEPGIHFLAEWLTNRLAVALGPVTFALPYHYGRASYQFNDPQDLRGSVADERHGSLAFHGKLAPSAEFLPSQAGSLAEWLMERYTAYNAVAGRKRYFRVWHPPWRQCAADMQITEQTLLSHCWPWMCESRLIGANYSPGFEEVSMGRPHKPEPPCRRQRRPQNHSRHIFFKMP